MPQINDAIDAAIVNVGATQNAIQDKLLRFYQANGAVSGDLDDAEFEFLIARGAGLVLGAELVADGNFLASAAWTEGVGWVAGGGKATINGTNVAVSDNVNTGSFLAVSSALLLHITSITAGSLQLFAGATAVGPVLTTPGFYRSILTPAAGLITIRGAIGTIAEVKQLSVRSVTAFNSGLLQVNDMWEYYLRVTKGFTGALDDMLFTYWTVGPRP